MGKFEKQAQELLDAIGGKENISAVTHCATRMRFVLNDDAKADKKRIENISTTKGMFTNAGQFQVIIGNDVATFYNDFSAVSGIEGVSKEAAKSAAKSNQNVIQKLVGTLSEIFTPLLPAIIVGGLILGFRNILEGVQIQALGQVVEDGVKKVTSEGVPVWNTITQVSPFWNGVNSFLWLPGEAIFHFLPVGIAWSVTRKMGTTQILGIVLGITLVSPQLLNAYAVNSTSAAEIAKNWSWDFGFFTMDKIGYQAQVIPAMAAGFLLAYLEKFFRKHIPEAVSMIFVPLFALIPTIIASHAIIGPIGWKIGQGISFVVNTGLTSSLSWLFGGIFGILYAPLVITGLRNPPRPLCANAARRARRPGRHLPREPWRPQSRAGACPRQGRAKALPRRRRRGQSPDHHQSATGHQGQLRIHRSRGRPAQRLAGPGRRHPRRAQLLQNPGTHLGAPARHPERRVRQPRRPGQRPPGRCRPGQARSHPR